MKRGAAAQGGEWAGPLLPLLFPGETEEVLEGETGSRRASRQMPGLSLTSSEIPSLVTCPGSGDRPLTCEVSMVPTERYHPIS